MTLSAASSACSGRMFMRSAGPRRSALFVLLVRALRDARNVSRVGRARFHLLFVPTLLFTINFHLLLCRMVLLENHGHRALHKLVPLLRCGGSHCCR